MVLERGGGGEGVEVGCSSCGGFRACIKAREASRFDWAE